MDSLLLELLLTVQFPRILTWEILLQKLIIIQLEIPMIYRGLLCHLQKILYLKSKIKIKIKD